MSAILYGGLATLQLAGGYFAAQNMRDTAELNNEIANMNAEFAELDAHDAILDGESEVARYQTVVDATISEQRLRLTAADVDVNYGSAAAITEETRFIAELNRMEIEKQAQETALGYKRQARDFRLGASLDLADSDARASATEFGAVTGSLDTLGKADFTGYGPKRSTDGIKTNSGKFKSGVNRFS